MAKRNSQFKQSGCCVIGKKDILTKQYLSRNDIFADAFNYYLFDGKQVICPEDLKEQAQVESLRLKHRNKRMAGRKP